MIIITRPITKLFVAIALGTLCSFPSACNKQHTGQLDERSLYLLEKGGERPHLVHAAFCVDDQPLIAWERAEDKDHKQILPGAQIKLYGDLADLGEVPNPWGGSSAVHLWATQYKLGTHTYRVELAAEGMSSRQGPDSTLIFVPRNVDEGLITRIQFALIIDGKTFSWWRIPTRQSSLTDADCDRIEERVVRITSEQWERSLIEYLVYDGGKCLFSLKKDSIASFLLDSSDKIQPLDMEPTSKSSGDVCLKWVYQRLHMVLSAGPPETRKVTLIKNTKVRIDFTEPTLAYLNVSVFAGHQYVRIPDFALITSVGYGDLPIVR